MPSPLSVHSRQRRGPLCAARESIALACETRRAPRLRRRAASGLALPLSFALLLSVTLGCSGAAEDLPARTSILLVTLDTTRTDHLGAYGDPTARTPHFDRLASEGLLFSAAQASSPLTLPTHTSILTGTYPVEHGVRDNGIFKLDDAARTLAEALQEAGWRTGAFVATDVLGTRFGLSQGFERYDVPENALERPAGAVVDATLSWLAEVPADAPYFAWVHFYDPHQPWTAPEPFASRFADGYAAEIAYMDSELGRLLAGIDAMRPDERQLIAITADHGESLGEHGEHTHGMLLHQAVTSIPLVLAGNALAPSARGARISQPVSQADLAPTLAAVAGLDPAAALPDSSLAPLLGAAGEVRPVDPARAVYIESFAPYHTYRWHPLQAVVQGSWKRVSGPTDELYDLARDPLEARDLAATQQERNAALAEALGALLDRHPPRAWSTERQVSVEEATQLAALGYVTGSASSEEISPDLPHPRDHIGVIGQVNAASEKMLEWRAIQAAVAGETAAEAAARQQRARAVLEEARDMLRAALAAAPGSPLVLVELGSLECALGNFEEGIALTTRGAAGRPADGSVRFDLALCLQSSGRQEEAIESAERAIALAPDQLHFYSGLVYILSRADNPAHSVSVLDRMEAARARYHPADAQTRAWIERKRAELVPE